MLRGSMEKEYSVKAHSNSQDRIDLAAKCRLRDSFRGQGDSLLLGVHKTNCSPRDFRLLCSHMSAARFRVRPASPNRAVMRSQSLAEAEGENPMRRKVGLTIAAFALIVGLPVLSRSKLRCSR